MTHSRCLDRSSKPHHSSSSFSVVLVACSVALSLFGDSALYAVLPVHFASMGLSPFHVGLILSLNRFIRIFTNRIAEKVLTSRYQALWVGGSLAAGALITVVYALLPPLVVLLGVRALWGLCWSIIRHNGVMTAIQEGQRDRIGRVLGFYQGIVGVGFIAGTFFGAYLYDLTDYRSAFLYLGGLSLIAVPFGLLSVRRGAVKKRKTSETVRVDGTLEKGVLIRGFIIAAVGTGLIMSTLGYVLTSRFGEQLSLGSVVIGIATVTGILLGAKYAVDSLGSPLLGLVIDRIGTRGTNVISLLGGAIILALMALFSTAVVLIPSLLLFFLFSSSARLATMSQAASSGDAGYARYVTVADVGAAMGPLLGWIGIDLSSNFRVTLLGGALLYFCAVLFVGKRST